MKKLKFPFPLVLALTAILPVAGATLDNVCATESESCLGAAGAVVTVDTTSQNGVGTQNVNDRNTYEHLTVIADKQGQLGDGLEGVFNWSVNYDVDPFFNWTFTSLLPGNYVVNFFIPVIGGPYNFLAHSAGGSITGIPGTTSIQNYMVVVEIPNGSPFGGGAFDLALPDTTAPSPSTVNIPVASKLGGIAPISPASMGVTVSWSHVGTGVINLNGGVVLVDNTVPEPATFALAGITLIGLAFLRRRKA